MPSYIPPELLEWRPGLGPWQVIDYNTTGKWSVTQVRERYVAIRHELGLEPSDTELVPRIYKNNGGLAWVYSVLEPVTERVVLGDPAAIELAIDYIVDNLYYPTSGYIRARMARRLKHVALADPQCERLRSHFMSLLRTGESSFEFREYAKLFVSIGPGPYLSDLREMAAHPPRRRAEKALSYLVSKFADRSSPDAQLGIVGQLR
jgi:hypothetical protein